MGGNGGTAIDHGVAQGTRFIALRRLDPDGIQSERRLLGGNTFNFAIHLAGVDGQFHAHLDLAFATHHALEHDVVAVGIDVEVVADAHRLHQKTQLG